MFLLFQDFVGILDTVAEQGTAILVLFLILVFVVVLVRNILPTWERVKTGDSTARESQAKALGELASSITQLATTQSMMATTVKDIAIEQRRATENVRILQRAATEESNQLIQTVDSLVEQINEMEAIFKEIKK